MILIDDTGMLQAEMMGSIPVAACMLRPPPLLASLHPEEVNRSGYRPASSGMLEVIEPMLLRTCHDVLLAVVEERAAYVVRST